MLFQTLCFFICCVCLKCMVSHMGVVFVRICMPCVRVLVYQGIYCKLASKTTFGLTHSLICARLAARFLFFCCLSSPVYAYELYFAECDVSPSLPPRGLLIFQGLCCGANGAISIYVSTCVRCMFWVYDRFTLRLLYDHGSYTGCV